MVADSNTPGTYKVASGDTMMGIAQTLSAYFAASYTGWGNMARGALTYVGAYVSNKIAGIETHFNWTDMAVATTASGISGMVGKNGSVGDMIAGANNTFSTNLVNNMWGSTVNSSLNRLTGRGERQNWGAMATDAFGNALASEAVKYLQTPPAVTVNTPATVDAPRSDNSPAPKTDTVEQSVREAVVSGNAGATVAEKDKVQGLSEVSSAGGSDWDQVDEVVVTGYRTKGDAGWSVPNSYVWQDHSVYDAYTGKYISTTLSNRDASIQWTQQLRDLHDERTTIMKGTGTYGPAQGFALETNEHRRNNIYDEIAKYND